MYKIPSNKEQSMAVFFICIILAVIMTLGFFVYFIWKKICHRSNPKPVDGSPMSQVRRTSGSIGVTVDLTPSTEQYGDETNEPNQETDITSRDSSISAGMMYTFPNEGVGPFRNLKSNGFRPGELFAHPSSYRQNLRLVGQTLHTVEEVEEGIDSPPRYEELFPNSANSSLFVDEDSVYYQEHRSSEGRNSVS